MAESLLFARNDRLQHVTRLSGVNQIHVLQETKSVQASMVYAVVPYGLLSVLEVISNPSHILLPHLIFGRISNNFYCPSAHHCTGIHCLPATSLAAKQ